MVDVTGQATSAAQAQAEIDLMTTIYDNIVSTLTAVPPGQSRAPFDSNRTVVVLLPRGQGIRTEDYTNPFSSENPAGSQDAARRGYDLGNVGLKYSQIWSPAELSITDLYKLVVNATVTPTALPPELVTARLKAARVLYKNVKDENYDTSPANYTPAHKSYAEASAAFTTAITEYGSKFADNQTSPEKKTQWPLIGMTYKAAVDKAAANLAAKAANIKAAEATLATTNSNQVAQLFQGAAVAFTPEIAGLLLGANDVIYPVEFSPFDWSDPSATFTTLTGAASRYSSTQHADSQSFSGSGGFSLGLWGVGASFSHAEQHFSAHADASQMSIAFSYELVTISRPWLSLGLFDLPNWAIGGFSPGSISNGKLTSQEASKLPLVPIAFYVVKDVELRGNWSQDDEKFAAQQTSAGLSVSYGPFSIGGQFNQSSQDKALSYEFANGKLIIHGLQIVAYVCAILPFSPPK